MAMENEGRRSSRRASVGSCDSSTETVSRCLIRARAGTTSQRDVDDAEMALKKLKQDKKLLTEENKTLRRKNEDLQTRTEQAEREVGRMEQGPEAAKKDVMVCLLEENARLKRKLEDIIKSSALSSTPSNEDYNSESKRDSFEDYIGIYIECKKGFKKDNESIREDAISMTGGDTHIQRDNNTVVSLRRHIQEQESVERRDPFVSLLQHHLPPMGNDSGGVSTVLTGAAAAALHKRSRSYNSSRPSYKYRGDESDEQACMQSAGLAAKRRRSRAQSWSCTSSRTRPTSQESISLDRFMEILNNSEDKGSHLTHLIMEILSTAHRPFEAHKLHTMLRLERPQTEFLLRHCVVEALVTAVQRARCREGVDVTTHLLQSSCSFVNMMDRQRPFSQRCHSYNVYST